MAWQKTKQYSQSEAPKRSNTKYQKELPVVVAESTRRVILISQYILYTFAYEFWFARQR
jgi:hypothetical protein